MAARDAILSAVAASLVEAGIDMSLSDVVKLADGLADRLPAPAAERRKWTAWTVEEDVRLREMWEAGETTSAIVEELGKTQGSVKGAVSRLKLTRPDGYKARGRPRKAAAEWNGS